MRLREDWRLAAIVLVLTPASILLSTLLSSRSEKHFYSMFTESGNLNAVTEEAFTNFATTKAYNLEDYTEQHHAELNERRRKAETRANFTSSIVRPLIAFTNALAYIAICLFGGWLIVRNESVSVGIVVTIAVAALHFFTQRYFDAKDGDKANEVDEATAKQEKIDVKGAPAWYGLLPMIPLVLLIVFNRFVIDTVKLDVPTAMFISFTVALCCELARKAVKDVLNTGFEFFNMMGRQFATVITLIVAGELFAKGLIATGTIDYLIAGTQNLGLPAYAIMIVVVSFISISCVVMGSGNAPFFAFAPLVPDFAQQFGVSTILLLMPMQLSTGLARVMSPITAVVVAVAGCSGISPFALVRRTAIPMTGGLIVMVLMTIIQN